MQTASPAKRARDAAIEAQLTQLARTAGVVFRDRDLLASILDLIRLGVPPKNIIAVLQTVGEARGISPIATSPVSADRLRQDA